MYYLKLFKLVFRFLSKLYDKIITLAEPLHFLNNMHIRMLHFVHQNQLLLIFCFNFRPEEGTDYIQIANVITR